MPKVTLTIPGTSAKVSTQSRRRYVLFGADETSCWKVSGSDNLATLQTKVRRAGYRHGRHFYIMDTADKVWLPGTPR